MRAHRADPSADGLTVRCGRSQHAPVVTVPEAHGDRFALTAGGIETKGRRGEVLLEESDAHQDGLPEPNRDELAAFCRGLPDVCGVLSAKSDANRVERDGLVGDFLGHGLGA